MIKNYILIFISIASSTVIASNGSSTSSEIDSDPFKIIHDPLSCGSLEELETYLQHKVRSPMWTIGFVYQFQKCNRIISYCGTKWIRQYL